jgi:hypothetical protein
MGANHKTQRDIYKEQHPEEFTQVSQGNSISDVMRSHEQIKRKSRQERFDELEEIILETPATDPKFEEYVSEYNNLKIKLQ